jgi:hypothetical protein
MLNKLRRRRTDLRAKEAKEAKEAEVEANTQRS